MYRLLVVSGIMAHSEVEIVPVLDVGIVTHSQSLIPFAGFFPWTAVKKHDKLRKSEEGRKRTWPREAVIPLSKA
jgi:hypothetical protein